VLRKECFCCLPGFRSAATPIALRSSPCLKAIGVASNNSKEREEERKREREEERKRER